MDDKVNSPRHYTQYKSGIECIAVTEHMNFCVGNAIKYLWRSEHKNGIEDLKKARWYVDREIARLEALQAAEPDMDLETSNLISRVMSRAPHVMWHGPRRLDTAPEK